MNGKRARRIRRDAEALARRSLGTDTERGYQPQDGSGHTQGYGPRFLKMGPKRLARYARRRRIDVGRI